MAGQSVLFLTPDDMARWQSAADRIVSRGSVTIDAAAVKADTDVLVSAMTQGANRMTFAIRTGKVTKSKSGKVNAHGNLTRAWRFAEYVKAAANDAALAARLDAGYSMTDADPSKLCQEVKPALVAAGLIEERKRAVTSMADRAVGAVTRTVKRIIGWRTKGIKATVGATGDVPPFPSDVVLAGIVAGESAETLARKVQEHWDARKPAETPPAENKPEANGAPELATPPPVEPKRTRRGRKAA